MSYRFAELYCNQYANPECVSEVGTRNETWTLPILPPEELWDLSVGKYLMNEMISREKEPNDTIDPKKNDTCTLTSLMIKDKSIGPVIYSHVSEIPYIIHGM